MMIDELIANYEGDEEENYDFYNQNFLEVKTDKVKKFQKMPSHEPITQWSQNLKDSLFTNNQNNQNGTTHQLKKTLTSSSLESNLYIRGNLVFTNNGENSQQQTPRKIDKQEYKLNFISPIFSREEAAKKFKQELFQSKDAEEESTNEKIQENQSSRGSVSPNSNQAVISNGETVQNQNIQTYEYEQADSNRVEVSDSQQENSHQKAFMKSKFSKSQGIEQGMSKDSSFNQNKSQNESDIDYISPHSLRETKQTTQKIMIASQQKIQSNQDITENEQKQNISTNPNSQQQNQFITPAQRRRSMLKPVETQRFKDIIDRKKEQLQTNEPKSPATPFSPVDKFKIAGTVARTLTRLQVNQVNKIESTDQLDREINHVKIRKNSQIIENQQGNANNDNQQRVEKKHDTVNEAFNMVRMVEMITDFAERGHPEDIDNMINILNKDPKKYIRSTDDPQHLLNKLNSKNQNSAYVACKNGNLNIVQFLVKNEVNFNIKSKVGGEIKEYPLQVAVRWNHKEIVDFLLKQNVVKIIQDQIQCAYKEAKTNDLKKLISKHLKKKSFFFCC